jgi:hypothetical protein
MMMSLWMRSLGAGVILAWVLSLAWWAVLEPASAEDGAEELVIPRGTAAAVAAGQPAPLIPNSLELGRDRTLLVRNEDDAPHQFGTWTIPPGGTAEISANTEDGQLSCTVHADGIIDVTVDDRPPFLTTVWSALGVGIPIGLVFGFAAMMGARLRAAGDGHEPATTPLE